MIQFYAWTHGAAMMIGFLAILIGMVHHKENNND